MSRIALVCVLVVWCTNAVAAPSAPRLFTDDEIKKFETATRARFAGYKDRHCSRPVLRGAPAAGRATTDLQAFEKPTGALAACVTTLMKLSGKDGLYDAVETRHPDLKAFDARCGAQLEAVVRKAVSHEDACSPFQIGSISEPATPL